jgi:hypothetical protein
MMPSSVSFSASLRPDDRLGAGADPEMAACPQKREIQHVQSVGMVEDVPYLGKKGWFREETSSGRDGIPLYSHLAREPYLFLARTAGDGGSLPRSTQPSCSGTVGGKISRTGAPAATP